MSDEARVIGAVLVATVELDARLNGELAHQSWNRELLFLRSLRDKPLEILPDLRVSCSCCTPLGACPASRLNIVLRVGEITVSKAPAPDIFIARETSKFSR